MGKFHTNEVWMKASVAGSLWAAFEIVIGSFLHNLHFPFTGMVMASIGVILLTSFSVLWKMKGIFWRAGLVCALMKSISPSAVILGPMAGIMLESLLMQLIVSLLGRNIIGYILGGSLALLSLLIHKAIGMLISYGFNFVVILDNMVSFVLKIFSIQNIDPLHVLYYYSALLGFVGILAALIGYFLGYKARKIQPSTQTYIEISGNSNKKFEESESKGILYLFTIIPLVVISLFLISDYSIILAFITTFSFFILSVVFYPKGLKPLYKPSILLNFAILLLFSIFFYDYKHSGFGWSNEGLVVGVKMLFRATIVFIGFATISIELRNPLVKNFLNNKGVSVIYNAMQTGFSILPSMIASLPSFKEMYSKPMNTISTKIIEADVFIQHQMTNGINNN
jgi:hypothetical protein